MKKFLALALSLLMIISLLPTAAFAEEAESGEEEKVYDYSSEEVIYGVLDADGSVDKILPVVVVDAEKDTSLSYYGNFSDVQNLSNTQALESKNGEVKLELSKGRFYFQGEVVSARLPWIIGIDYILDGSEISPEELGGKSGKLEIVISVKKNEEADESFFKSYLLQLGLTLDSAKCRNILADGATMANAGSNKMINFMVMPGSEGEFRVSSDVSNFSMAGLSVAAVPASMAELLENAGGITDGIDQLSGALNQLSWGVASLHSGASQLAEGINQFGAGLNQLSAGSKTLVDASAQILEGLRQISAIMGMIQDVSSDIDLTKLQFLPGALRTLADCLDAAASVLEGLAGSMDGAIEQVSAALNGISGIAPEEIQALQAANPDSAALNALISNYYNALSAQSSWSQSASTFCLSSGSMAETAARLREYAVTARSFADAIEQLLSEEGQENVNSYIDQLASLGDNYAMFHEGLVAYTGGVDMLAENFGLLAGGTGQLVGGTAQLNAGTSQIPAELEKMLSTLDDDFVPHSFLSEKNENVQIVQFVLSTQGISAPAAETEAPAADEELSGFELFLERFADLFRKSE